MTVYTLSWQELTNEKITNLFLYGTLHTPASFFSRLRGSEADANIPVVSMDTVSFMQSGPGRYARASEIGFVQRFFDGEFTFPEKEGEEKGYTKDEIIKLGLGVTSKDFNFVQEHYQVDAESPDYALRTYIYNHLSFTVSQSTLFVIENGEFYIKNLQLLVFDEKFDFTSGSGIANAGNHEVLIPAIDPYHLSRNLAGEERTINIFFNNKENVATIECYDADNYAADQVAMSNIGGVRP